MKYLLPLLCWIICLPISGQSVYRQTEINALTANLSAHKTRSTYDSLHAIIASYYSQLTNNQRIKIRTALADQARWATATLCTDQEKGPKLTISGRITDEQGKPIANARLAVYHADQNGYYAPSDAVSHKMSENDPRLFGFLLADQSGNHQFQTVRPASYPTQYNGRTIPQHIHINCTAQGYKTRMVQLVFTDDPNMNDPYWRSWATKQIYPVAQLKTINGTVLHGNCDLIMAKL